MIEVHCRLSALLAEMRMTREELCRDTGLPRQTVDTLCADTRETLDLREVALLLDALGCDQISDLYEVSAVGEDAYSDLPMMSEDEWYSPCPASPSGKHEWHKDMDVSDSVYQEFYCQICKRKLSMIL